MNTSKKIGIVGCGTIGRKVATELDLGKVPGASLAAISSRNLEKAKRFADSLMGTTPVVSTQELVSLSDLVVEAATGEAVGEIAMLTLSAGKDLIVLSCGALLDRNDLFAMAEASGSVIHIPSGAIAGLDGVISASAGRIDSVTMTTRKPPDGLKGSPGVVQSGLDLDSITKPVLVYEGPVKEAYRLFPANVNVSAALSMAGIGPNRTTIRIYADPSITRNTHEVVVEGEFGRLAIKIENVPSPANPRTGMLSALSAIATLKKITSHVRVGT